MHRSCPLTPCKSSTAPRPLVPRSWLPLWYPTLVTGTDLLGFCLGVSVPVLSGLPVYQVTVHRSLSDPLLHSLFAVYVCACACVCVSLADTGASCSLSLKESGATVGALGLSEQRRKDRRQSSLSLGVKSNPQRLDSFFGVLLRRRKDWPLNRVCIQISLSFNGAQAHLV